MKHLLATIAILLAAPSLFASADLVTTAGQPSPVRSGFNASIFFQVRNSGPDTATGVKLSITSDVPTTCSCDLGDIPPGQLRGASVSYVVPSVNGTIAFSGTASSSTPDPNPSNNSASVVVNVSADPDVSIGLSTPFTQDLSLPFTVDVLLGNFSHVTAHDIEATIDFSGESIGVQSLPAACSDTGSGRIICHLDSLSPTLDGPGPRLSLHFVAPEFYGDGSVTFRAVVVEREHDFDPISNATTTKMLLYKTFYAANTNNAGSGSLRQAILDANAQCLDGVPCAIAFRITQASPKPWKSIVITSPLPAVTVSPVRIDGGTQSAFFGDTNPDGPEIEITGRGLTDGDGLVITNCNVEVANLAINGFLRNGLSIADRVPSGPCPAFGGGSFHHLFVGTDPTGSAAIPNARGIGTSFVNGTNIGNVRGAALITDSVISGNLHSGIFGLSGRLNIARNRIGVKAHSDDPLPNGNAGVFIGTGGYGSDVGTSSAFATSTPDQDGNVIAFNGEMGVAVARGVGDVAIRNNRIWGNKLLGIDIGLDGPTQSGSGVITMPAVTLAHYDPVTRQTVIEGDFTPGGSTFSDEIDVYANDAPDPTGLGEGQRPIGVVRVPTGPPPSPHHFRLTVDGDLTGQFISATLTRANYVGFAKPEGIDQLLLTQTSEFSPTIEVR